ncbi:MAG TPA: electron transfer flavoprotein subunit alpha/FixB family protein [Acidimicrobiales bacterium]|nr:electron transfer flavoprotein subunit alpha/FixB family protein [Acidimicrobiales bacterium]
MAIDTIWVFAQSSDGVPTTGTLELLTKARSLTSGTVAAFHGGGDADGIAGALGAYGASKLYTTGDLEGRLPGPPVAAAMKAVIDGGDAPDLILFAQTYEGRDVAGRLSVKLDRTVLTNNTDIAVDGDAVNVTTAIFGGNLLVTTTFTSDRPYLALFRPKSFAAEESGGGPAEVVTVPVPDLGATGGARVTAVHVEEATGPKLDEAAIVVSGGRGLGEAGKYEMIEQLAKLLKGAPGASRAIVDAGWVPYSYQVGQTGKVVKPTVYIAAGISGATQHMVGMKGAKNIVAINKDKEAPIFSIADLGIVGDVHKVLPKLIEALQARG